MAKGTRITVDLGNEEFLKAIKIAAVEQDKSIREIVIDALRQWLDKLDKKEGRAKGEDFQAMIKAVSEYRESLG